MNRCGDEGTLRAWLDHELPAHEQQRVTAHLMLCQPCQRHADRLRVQAVQMRTLLAGPAHLPNPQRAFHAVSHRGSGEPAAAAGAPPPHQTPTTNQRRIPMRLNKSWAATAAVVLVLVGLLALPPVRALADQLLQVFRVQKVVFVPINEERIAQLENLNFDDTALFVGEPKVINDPAEPREVATLAEASEAVGYALQQPADLPGAPVEPRIEVQDRSTVEFQVDAEGVRELLALLNINDVTIPDTVSDAPIQVNMEPAVFLHYEGDDYTLALFQGYSPQVSMPEGVDMEQLGMAMLRVLGMESTQARNLARDIDWSSTLVVPLPADMESIRQVTINGEQGLLTSGGHYDEDADKYVSHKQLYWQQGDHVYVLVGGDIANSDMVRIAESVQ